MKELLCLLFAAFLLCVSASALELPSGLDDIVPRELIDSAEAGDDLLLRGGQYLFSHFRAALQDAVANSLRGAMALMLLSLLCGLIEGTAESAGETPARYAGYLGVLGAAALSAGDLSALIGLGVETMDELSAMAKLLLPTIAAAMAGGGCVGSASVWQVGALMLSDIFLSLMRDVLVPVRYCMIGTAAAGALLEQSRLSLLSKGIGKLLSWGLSAILIVFTAFLSVSNLLAGSADRLAVKVGKTVISGAVPVVGGILSDATEAVAAGVPIFYLDAIPGCESRNIDFKPRHGYALAIRAEEELPALLQGCLSGALDPTAMVRRRSETFPRHAAANIVKLLSE